jgi:hypothetical protein
MPDREPSFTLGLLAQRVPARLSLRGRAGLLTMLVVALRTETTPDPEAVRWFTEGVRRWQTEGGSLEAALGLVGKAGSHVTGRRLVTFEDPSEGASPPEERTDSREAAD